MQTSTVNESMVSEGRARVAAARSEPASLGRATIASAEVNGCFHCGTPVRGATFSQGEKRFCCQGCLTVFELLSENGLTDFYQLGGAAGVRIQRAARAEEFKYLDEPAVRQRLVDFASAEISRVTFRVPAIHCIACVWLLENLFRLHPGVSRSLVNFPRREVSIYFVPGKIKFSELVALLASLGYEPSLTLNELEERKTDPALKRRWIQVGLAGFAFGNIMLFSLPRYLGMDSFSGAQFAQLFGWLSLVLAAPVVIYSASDYWRSALLSLRRRVLTLDVPIALGLAAIYGQSAYEIISRAGDGYCDSLTGLIFFLLCGRAFQQKTHERLAFDRDYKSFFPLSVTRKSATGAHANTDDGAHGVTRPTSEDGAHGVTRPTSEDGAHGVTRPTSEESVSISQLQVGDRILIRNGELIPADAKLTGGAALIDYSFVTGESEPVAKSAGDYLYAGGKQMGGAIEVETLKAVSQSYLMSLWNHETFQKNSDDSLNSFTNLYSRRFTRIVVVVAIVAAVFWIAAGQWPRGIKAFTSVLIVACPCALALAAPFTLGTAQRWLARANVFVKNALVLERLSRVDAVVFDKTGTLTAANSANELFRGEPLNKAEAVLVVSLARHSTHPYSRRICESLGNQGCQAESLDSFVETPGSGIEGKIGEREVWLGSQRWLASRGVRSAADSPALQGSCVHLAIDGRERGTFVLANELRPETERLLRELGGYFEIALLSGDNEREREQFGQLFGPGAKLHFNQSPLDKLGFIKRLQESGRTVMMVGDGLNDAGALKQSDVGVAVVEKVGTFSPASDVIIEASRVPRLVEILTLARQSARVVRLSFGISAAYNLIGIGIAASGLLSPLTCAVLMPVSSVSVVLFACGVTTWLARRAGLGVETK